jgi:hypothetical protein
VLEEEVLVAPGLEARVQVGTERRQRVGAGAVEVLGVLFLAVVGRQVHAAAEPHHGRLAGRQRGEHAHVHVHRGHHRVARVEHQAHAHGLERRAGQFGPVLGGRWRQLRALHMAEVAAAAFQQAALFHQLGLAVTLQPLAGRAHPGIGVEGLAVGLLQGVDDALLQSQQVGAHGVGVHRVSSSGPAAACCRRGRVSA